MRHALPCFFAIALALGCSAQDANTPDDAGLTDAAPAHDASDATLGDDAHVDAGADASPHDDASDDAAPEDDAAPPVDAASDASPLDASVVPCSTRVSYGSAWNHPANHPDAFDTVADNVTWDGVCTDDGANSYAVLSNGWRPSFQGNGACILALDHAGSCASAAAACTTRVTYGAAWQPPAGHAARFDDVTGRVFSDGVCNAAGANSSATLSNGWTPNFSGASSCRLSFRYSECGGVYTNPVAPFGCADPGVLKDGSRYVLACTSGNATNAYALYTSTDLVTWTAQGHIFPSAQKPTWAQSDFWAPEIHKVGAHYVAYFSARGADGVLAIGAASAPSALGPYTDIGHALIHDPAMGLIDVSEVNAPAPYVLWKEDGNAVGKHTPIHAQPLAADGLSLTGSASTLITNDQSWEGGVVEGPFMIPHNGMFYLFYSGNSYANGTYAVGVARASAPTGPFTKASGPIVVTGGPWVGPGHNSVVDSPQGGTAIVYHAWPSNCVNGPGCGRELLVDAVTWENDWPAVRLAPSSTSRPLF